MIAFHEAIGGYAKQRGSFLKYASMLIRSRLIDYARKERRHRQTVSLDAPRRRGGERPFGGRPCPKSGTTPRNPPTGRPTRQEIEELSRQMESFGVSLSDVADNCPKQQRTLLACRKALAYARENSWLLEELVQGKKLPLAKLSDGSGVERKTLERPPEIPGGPAADLHQRV